MFTTLFICKAGRQAGWQSNTHTHTHKREESELTQKAQQHINLKVDNMKSKTKNFGETKNMF